MEQYVTRLTSTQCAKQLRQTNAQLLRALNWALQSDALLQTRKSSVSAWTPAQHLEHINRGNEVTLEAILALLNGPAPLQPETVRKSTREFLARGVFQRGICAVADFSEPQGLAPEEIRDDCRAMAAGYGALERRLEDIAGCFATDPHEDLGPLTANDWLRFTEIHTAHHLQIACEIAGGNL